MGILFFLRIELPHPLLSGIDDFIGLPLAQLNACAVTDPVEVLSHFPDGAFFCVMGTDKKAKEAQWEVLSQLDKAEGGDGKVEVEEMISYFRFVGGELGEEAFSIVRPHRPNR